jgi:hypothetical protein
MSAFPSNKGQNIMQQRWFKMPVGTASDAVLRLVSRTSNAPFVTAVAVHMAAVEHYSEHPRRFHDDVELAQIIALGLEMDNEQLVYDLITRLKCRGYIQENKQENAPLSNAERQKLYRDRKRNDECDVTRNVTRNAESNVTGDVTSNALEREEREKEKKEPPLPPEGDGEGFQNLFEEFFSKRAGRGKATDSAVKARREYDKLIAAGETHEALCNALQSYAAWCHSEGKAGTRWVKSVAAWLADGDWEPHAGQQSMPLPPPQKTFEEICAEKGVKCSPWLIAMAAKIGATKALGLFGAADFDGKKITFAKKVHRELAIVGHEHEMREVFGADFEMEVKKHG